VTPGLRLVGNFVTRAEHEQVIDWLKTLHPLWELRFSTVRPLPAGETQRMLHRPVYWLGNWQFAYLGYYHPPHIDDRCVEAEPFPEVLLRWQARMEQLVRERFPPAFVPRGWTLNTCLVNFYGSKLEDGKKTDHARVGAHRDFEPGPVGSVSLGERALFQFARRDGSVVEQHWLDDRSLVLFAGPTYKDRLFHRVQRVDRREQVTLPPDIEGFVTRRVNFTFRYVPPEHIVPYAALSPAARADVVGYVTELARHSPHWEAALHKDHHD
jgi:alkylated DNA repair protein (DNA oxidative demethylase)